MRPSLSASLAINPGTAHPARALRRAMIILLTLACGGVGPAMARADSPRERLRFDSGWRFHLGDAPDAGNQFDYSEPKNLTKTEVFEVGLADKLATNLPDPVATNLGGNVSFVRPDFDDRNWRSLDLPHDWAVEMPFSTNADLKHGFKTVGTKCPEGSIGWYRREFDLPASDRGRRLGIEFDGVFRNCLVWLNGHCLGRNVSGYTSFRRDISQYAKCGGRNELVVRVDASRFEGWFYEGAGIYRHVWLVKTSPVHIAPDGLFVWTEFPNNAPGGNATVHIQATMENTGTNAPVATVRCEVINPDGKSLGQAHHSADLKSGHGQVEAKFVLCPREGTLRMPVIEGDVVLSHAPVLWSPESPKLYRLITTVEVAGNLVDRLETEFGIRTVAFDAAQGFLLNGKPYLVKGTCNHQDHAGVGSALPDRLQYYRVERLKEMGCNAYRTSHNPPTPELLEACDRLGLLVMDEARRMDTTAQALDELKRLVLRDRNHPGVFIWSLGNEEFHLQGASEEARAAAVTVATAMQNLAHQLDPTRRCTVAMNGGWGTGFSTVIDVQGFNYHTGNIDKFRAKFPTQPTIGTETGSTRTTRGIYADDKQAGYVAAYGENGVSKPWGWWPYFATNSFTSGGFVWTGFDYRGEPTPYKWPCINSHFGLMDMCGFPKDIYYYYQSWWTDKPVLHVMPHWNWPGREGQNVHVRVFSNAREVELFLNGRSLGRQTMPLNQYLDWEVKYEPGTLVAKGFDDKGKVAGQTQRETTGAPSAVQFMPDRSTIQTGGEDVSVVNVAVVDSQGRVVPLADNLMHFALVGPGQIIGVGNGDPSSHEADNTNERHAFNGLAQVIVQSGSQSGILELTATSPGLRNAWVKIKSQTGSVPSSFAAAAR